MNTKNKLIAWLLLVGVMVCVLLGIASLLEPTRALPPRPPTPTFTVQPDSASKFVDSGDVGVIELQVHFPSTWPWNEVHWQELWTVAQWQDNEGRWRDVEGWRGTLDRVVVDEEEQVVGRKTWWVAESDLGRGPFRWRVYRSQGGRLLATSDEFTLPETVAVEVVLESP